MTNGNLLKVLMIAAATIIVVSILPDVKRYIRISTM